MENVIPLSKLIGLLFLFCLPLLSILFLTDLTRPVMGTIFLVYIYMLSVCRSMSVVCQIICVGRITWPMHMLKVFFGAVKPVTTLLFISYTLEL